MTYEELKKIRNDGQIEHANIRELQKLIDVAIEKQIPKKPHPIKVVVDRLEIGNASWGKGTIVYRCPACETYMSRLHDYCYKCGQRIDWSGAGDQTKWECEQE